MTAMIMRRWTGIILWGLGGYARTRSQQPAKKRIACWSYRVGEKRLINDNTEYY